MCNYWIFIGKYLGIFVVQNVFYINPFFDIIRVIDRLEKSIMKKYIYMILNDLKYLLILWLPILIIEETILFDYVSSVGAFIVSILASLIGLFIYIEDYKRIDKNKVNRYIYNIANVIILGLSSLSLGYLFVNLVDMQVFHHCMGQGWDCFLFGIEYLLIGFYYASFTLIILIIWLIVRFIKHLK